MCAGMRKERFQDTMIDVVIDTIDGKVMLEMCLRLEELYHLHEIQCKIERQFCSNSVMRCYKMSIVLTGSRLVVPEPWDPPSRLTLGKV